MHELKLMDVWKRYKDKDAVREVDYTFTNGVSSSRCHVSSFLPWYAPCK